LRYVKQGCRHALRTYQISESGVKVLGRLVLEFLQGSRYCL